MFKCDCVHRFLHEIHTGTPYTKEVSTEPSGVVEDLEESVMGVAPDAPDSAVLVGDEITIPSTYFFAFYDVFNEIPRLGYHVWNGGGG